MSDLEGRRPLKVRELGISQAAAHWLSQRNITPNQISIASVGFGAAAATCLLMLPGAVGWQTWGLALLAALAIQCRLLCNLFDGMVAVEGAKSTASGELFNDIPDRIADPLILVCAGYAVSSVPWAPDVGWAAGLLAVMTAYVRTLASSIGAKTDFRGPMAKQHRMALMTAALVLTSFESFFWPQGTMVLIALLVIVAGALITIARRVRAAYLFLEAKDAV